MIFSSDSLVKRVDAFNGTQARQLLSALDSVGLNFVALRLDPDPTQPVTEIDLLLPLRQRNLRRSLKRASAATPFRFSFIKSSSISSTVIASLTDDDTLRLVSLDVRGPIIKRQARFWLSFDIVNQAGVQRPSFFNQPAPLVESSLLLQRNAIDGRVADAKHKRILVGSGKSTEDLPRYWSSQFRIALRALSLVCAIQKSWFVLTRGRRATNIAIHGPDGAGKSTLASSVAAALHDVGIEAFVWHYLKPVRNTKNGANGNTATSKALRKSIWVRRLAWPYLAISAILRTRVSGFVLVHDRYIYDILEKDIRKGVGRSRAVERMISFVSASFSTAYVLDSPVARMLDRGEQTPDEIEASNTRMRRIPGHRLLEGSLSLEQLTAHVLQHWLKLNAVRRP